MARSNQQGSILGFVAIAGILAFLLIGGILFVRQNLSSSSTGVPIASDEEDDQPEVVDPGSDFEEVEPNDEPDDEVVVLPGGSGTISSPDTNEEVPADLPQTGPAGMLFSSVLLGGLIAAGVTYKRSRDALADALLTY